MALYDLYGGVFGTSVFTGNYTLGLRFKAACNGNVNGVRVFKHALQTNPIVGKLWSDLGVQLAAATRAGDSVSGLVDIPFASPYAITGGTYYYVSYYFPSLNYYYGNTSAAGGPLTPLSAVASAERYQVGDTFPNQFFSDTNYSVDVIFDDQGNFVKPDGLSAMVDPGVNGYLKQLVSLDASATESLAVGNSRKVTTDGNPVQPCLAIDIPNFRSLRWGVTPGTRTISVLAKQVSNVAGKRPRMIVRANPDIGVNSDVIVDAPAGAGWVTLGPAIVTPSDTGQLWVELWNMDTDNFDSPAFFDHLTAT